MANLKFPLRLDPNFEPMILKLREFKEKVAASEKKVPVAFCVERNNGYVYRKELDVFVDGVNDERNIFIVAQYHQIS